MKGPLCALTFVTIGSLLADGAAPAQSVEAFLSAKFNLQSDDFRTLEARRPLARTLEAADDREVAAIGAIRLDVPAAFYFEQLRNIAEFKRGEAVPQIGVFSNPARPEDASGLMLDPDEVAALARCRPGACNLQLSREMMDRFHTEVPWRTDRAVVVANEVLRRLLANMVNRYRELGDVALMTYADGKQPVSVATEFASMIASPPAVLSRFPMLHNHVNRFPARRGVQVDDVVYWSKEKLGSGTVISVTHLALTRVSEAPVTAFAAASRQLFGSHYFDASLGLTAVVQDPATASAPAYVVYVNRSRLDVFDGFFGGLKRTIVRSRMRSAVANKLVAARDRVERRFRRQGSG